MSSSPALSCAVYWGTAPEAGDTASHLFFSSQRQADAYWLGVDQASCYAEVRFLPHAGFYVNSKGQVTENTSRSFEVKDTERHVIWEEKPEAGVHAQTFAFESKGEAEAFQEGASDSVGWFNHFVVPSQEFKPCHDLDEAYDILEEGEARETFDACVEREGLDLVFVRPDGAFVRDNWNVGVEVENAPLSFEEWKQGFDESLRAEYAVGVVDIGLDDAAIEQWRQGPNARYPEGAAEDYAIKYSLTPRSVTKPRAPGL